MKGKIQNITPDEQYAFKGTIIMEDGTRYAFNSGNWLKKDITIDDIAVDAEVEFELKSPNKNGNVFPKQIRFAGETNIVQRQVNSFDTKHSHGSIQDFVYIKTQALIAPLTKLVEGFVEQGYAAPKNLFRIIANSYNALEDEEFIFETENGADIVRLPSGFVSKDGHIIYLYCTKNSEANKAEWVCDRVVCDNHIIGGAILRDIVNADWYDIVSNLKELLPDLCDDVRRVVQNIENRCMFNSSALIWLKDGLAAPEDSADHLYVPTGYTLKDGKELYLCCTKNKGIKGYGWYFDCITYENAPLDVYDKKSWLGRWAQFEWEDICPQIIQLTFEERWSFCNRGDYGVLKNYLIYTFARQWKEGAIGYSSDGKYAAFNTGLPDRVTYKYIYAFFEAIERKDQPQTHPLHFAPQYRFKSCVLSGRAGDGKTLAKSISPLPSPPKYFASRSSTVWELDFNENNQVKIPEYDDTHILIHRCERVPLDFYRSAAYVSERLRNILDAETDSAQKYKDIREFFMPIVVKEKDKKEEYKEAEDAYQKLAGALNNVISDAIKKLSWNWRAVVPCYNPEQEEPCYLLPVSFCDTSKPDRALLASADEVDGEMVYTIHTVISLEWAYLDARLVCRPESEWLALDGIN